MENSKLFNLIDEPWIRVRLPNCEIQEVSLETALLRSHEYSSLAGEIPTQNVAILRLLLAVIHTALSRSPITGKSIVIDEDTAEELWGQIWDAGKLPSEPIKCYLERWYDSFWLFHPIRPFFQVPAVQAKETKETRKLNGEISESRNKLRLFPARSGGKKDELSFAEAARWLIHYNGYDDTSLKNPSPKIAWLGQLGIVLSRGNTLFETLMLNLVLLDWNDEPWGENRPTWELPLRQQTELEKCSIPMPDNPAELYTLQFRRIQLIRDGNFVRRFSAASGEWFDRKNSQDGFQEPMTAWELEKDKVSSWYQPKLFSSDKQAWREFSSIIFSSQGQKMKDGEAGTVRWNRWLVKNSLVPKNRYVFFETFGMEYDSNRSSFTNIVHDSIIFHKDLLLDSGKQWYPIVCKAVNRCDELASAVGELAGDLEKAAGHVERDSKGNVVPSRAMDCAKKARELYYHKIDVPFREWLRKLDPAQSDVERDKLRDEWIDTAKQIALDMGEELVKDAGDAAMLGRFIEEKKGSKVKRHYSAPEAFIVFKHSINRICIKEG